VVRHPEKTLSKESLRAGTGFDIEFPPTIRSLAQAFLKFRKKANRYYSNITESRSPLVKSKPVVKNKDPHTFF
jgi:hypothetical protein